MLNIRSTPNRQGSIPHCDRGANTRLPHRASLGSTRLISMMGFLSLLKPISEISLGLGLSIRGSPDSVASASKFQLNWPRESVATYFSLDNSLLFDKTSGDSESQNYYYNRTA
jgi:hypothetical protein